MSDEQEIKFRQQIDAHAAEERLRKAAYLLRIKDEARPDVDHLAELVALKIRLHDITLSEYMQERVQEWYRNLGKFNCPIMDYLGMTPDEYAAWITDDKLSDRIERIQLHHYVSRVLRGHR